MNDEKTPDQKYGEWWKEQKEKHPIIEEYSRGELFGCLTKINEPIRVLADLLKAKAEGCEDLFATLHDVLNESEARHIVLYHERGRESFKTHLPEVPQEQVEVILRETLWGPSMTKGNNRQSEEVRS